VFYIDRQEIFDAIELERERQETIHPMIKKKDHEDADVNAVTAMLFHNEMLAVLTEEFLEVVRAIQGEGSLREELVQVAAVCVRWLENYK
jgi:NTP pyrophosphatase (non-canonical NTP hydrolase)